MKTSQNQFVLNHLIDHGYITDVVARNYGIRRLASRIHDLTAQPGNPLGGIEINSDMRVDDAGVKYAYYTLTAEVQEREKASRERGGTWRRFVTAEEASAAA